MNKFKLQVGEMIAKVYAHAKLYGWFTSYELTLSLLLAVLFWFGVYLVIIDGESLIAVGLYLSPMPIYGVIRVYLHMTGKLRIPFIS